jgi:hypothetical protein
MNKICKNSVTPFKSQSHKSQELRKQKRGLAKGIGNIINKMIAENFPNLGKEMPIQVQEDFRTLKQA